MRIVDRNCSSIWRASLKYGEYSDSLDPAYKQDDGPDKTARGIVYIAELAGPGPILSGNCGFPVVWAMTQVGMCKCKMVCSMVFLFNSAETYADKIAKTCGFL